MAAVGPDQLTPAAFSSPEKHAEVVALLTAYERFLHEHQRADMATVYQEAVRHPDWCPIQPQDCWTELPDAHWNPLQRALLDSLPGERIEPRTWALPGVTVPRRLTSARITRLAPEPGESPMAFLMTPPAAPAKQRTNAASQGALPFAAAVQLFHAGGRDAEVEEVFRRILATGVSLDQVEIACASHEHLALVWEKALRHDWPVTVGAGMPATFTRPGRALLGFCDWIETDFAAGHLRRLLQSGDVRVGDDEGFTAGQAARVLARAEAGWGRATYDLALSRLHRAYATRASDPDESDADRADAQTKADRTAQVQTWVAALMQAVPVPDATGTVPLQAVVSGVLDFLDHHTSRASALDERAGAALHDYVRDLGALGAYACALPQALRFIRERVESLTVAPERPRPGHLFAATLAHAGYAGRPHLFVVGLEEGRVFSSSTEDAVLLDAERAAIAPGLRLSGDRVDEAVYAVLSRLAASGAEVTFSYSCCDTREYRDTYASWLMLQAYRLQQGDGALSYQHMKAALGEPVSAVPSTREAALSSTGWWLRGVVGSGEAGAATLAPAFPSSQRGRRADEQRATDAFTAFDGHVPEAGPALDPCAPGNIYSVTELERAAECPFRFFLKRGLGVRPPGERERDKDVWLDPLTRGSELHDLYAALLRRVRDAGRAVGPDDAAWLREVASARLQQIHLEMPAATDEVLARETREFLADVELFVEAEARDQSATAVGLEVSFGRPLDEESEPLDREAPVAIDLGAGLTLRIAGRIDRINQIGDAAFEVVDYKTGGYYRPRWTGAFAGGTRLQHALYGLAAAELLKTRTRKARVERGVYYFSSHKGHQERVVIPAATTATLGAVLGDLREVITSGQFVRTDDAGSCRFCDYAAACGEHTNAEAKAKRSDPRVEAVVRLAAHE